MAYKGKYDYLNNKEEFESVIEKHKKNGSIFQDITVSKPQKILNFSRAENELKHAETVFKVSINKNLKREFDLVDEDTFYSGVISHCYYAIFSLQQNHYC